MSREGFGEEGGEVEEREREREREREGGRANGKYNIIKNGRQRREDITDVYGRCFKPQPLCNLA